MKKMENFTKNEKNGAWAISCSQHGFINSKEATSTNAYLVPSVTGINIATALGGYLSGKGPRVTVDNETYPDNKACNGIKSNLVTE